MPDQASSAGEHSALCQNCNKSQNLKKCAKCQTTWYCSRDCQKADWKKHKKVCSNYSAEKKKSPIAKVDKPFHKLHEKKWLHDRPKEDVYALLIDSYRFRVEDDYKYAGNVDKDSPYNGGTRPDRPFRRFLNLAEEKGLLPPDWTNESSQACLDLGLKDKEGWSYLMFAIEKSDIIEHYNDNLMPMQLRMFAEQVYGTGPGGQSGAGMLDLQMKVERGELYGSNLSMGI